MSINHAEGVPGAGKTVFMTGMGYTMQHNYGTHLYSNYHIEFKDVDGRSISKPVDRLEKLHDLSRLKTKNNLFIGDELWKTLSSTNSNFLVKRSMSSVTQSRKTETDVISSTQHMMQALASMRRVSTYIYRPEITMRVPNTKIPLMLRIFWYNCQDMRENGHFDMSMLMDNPRGKPCFIPYSYDTHEVVEEYKSDETERFNELLEKYKRHQGMGEKLLTAKILAVEQKENTPIKQKMAKLVAQAIEYELV